MLIIHETGCPALSCTPTCARAALANSARLSRINYAYEAWHTLVAVGGVADVTVGHTAVLLAAAGVQKVAELALVVHADCSLGVG